jgi:hypothetical protein
MHGASDDIVNDYSTKTADHVDAHQCLHADATVCTSPTPTLGSAVTSDEPAVKPHVLIDPAEEEEEEEEEKKIAPTPTHSAVRSVCGHAVMTMHFA